MHSTSGLSEQNLLQIEKKNFELAFTTGEKVAGVPDFLTAEDMSGMVEERRVDPKMVFSYVQEVYRMCNELQQTPSQSIDTRFRAE